MTRQERLRSVERKIRTKIEHLLETEGVPVCPGSWGVCSSVHQRGSRRVYDLCDESVCALGAVLYGEERTSDPIRIGLSSRLGCSIAQITAIVFGFDDAPVASPIDKCIEYYDLGQRLRQDYCVSSDTSESR